MFSVSFFIFSIYTIKSSVKGLFYFVFALCPALTWASSWWLWIKYTALYLQRAARGCTALLTRVLLLDEVPRNHNPTRNKAGLDLDFRRSGSDYALLYIHSNETTNTSEIFQSLCPHKIRCFLFPPCQNFSEEANICALRSFAVKGLSCSSTFAIAWCLHSQLINICMHYLLPSWLEKHFLTWYVFLLHLQWLPASHSFSKYYTYLSNLFTVNSYAKLMEDYGVAWKKQRKSSPSYCDSPPSITYPCQTSIETWVSLLYRCGF